MSTPLAILRESIKAVPAVKYALGLVGVACAIVLMHSFISDYRVAVLGILVMFLMMTALVVFAKLSSLAGPDLRLPALVFTWFSLFFVIFVSIAVVLSVFFKWPVDLQSWLTGQSTSHQSEANDEKRRSQIELQASDSAPQGPSTTEVAAASRPDLRTVPDSVASTAIEVPGTINGADVIGSTSPKLNKNCPEVTIFDYSKYPPDTRIERVCAP
ncbi:hypothetical protein [Paraburkholderia hospita]|uniref:hypothetical protein n=1 Tax=Paraburkholderia hospita TaxID=169430 RepID=UPI0009A80C63|nr:hypothetical protein [Paraburkholderia hospita]SKC49249.1 hypothetical protein SAMN05446934_0269 [Paraburkholderia hospita]